MRILTATAAGLALAATALAPLAAQPGKNNGQGQGQGKGNQSAKAERGNSGGGAKQRGNDRADRGNGNANRGVQTRGNDRGPDLRRANQGNQNAQGNRGNGNGNGNASRAASRVLPVEARGNGRGNGNGNAPAVRRGNDRGGFVQSDRGFSVLRDYDRRVALYDGCPPGLAKKYNGCQPPGLAKKRAYNPNFFGYGGLGGGRFFYDDGFLLRLGDGGRISASIPLLGGALSIGNPWPDYYQPVQLRDYYVDYYGLERDRYRYANNVVYRVDPETAAITSIAALLTGDDFTVGQPVPRGYDVYNVPYAYRDRYYDRQDAYYRYSDGYVYQIDPETRLVAAAIELLVD
ncbi:hypothetical protein [Erythrobacter sp. HKB08]|uniref:hypothetical protein n=1 Tax=Erythrobacter sp. HKB08 TaxID=2502843 RepID=UPI0010092BA9|nr:hypothetical protein [Erythrobacter sp. HKB08]